MKTWKHFNVMAIVAIIALAFVIIACDDGNKTTHIHDWGDWIETIPPTITEDGLETRICKSDPSHQETRPINALAKPLFGTWVDIESGGGGRITLNTDLFKLEASDDSLIMKIDNPVWTIAINENEDTKEEYPSGYTLSGISSTDSLSPNISVAYSIFINAKKTKFSWGGTTTIFTKL